ncbi:helix-turn-helix domain-containing protein [Cohnella sp.]|uniref:response regulator transcription factor n=1 Tax=Cohnella sp. TaxID=1883426 RepID=UPI0035624108
MKRISVMIVDDEVLAIEHIRQLVSWEQLGYEIVCTATKPSQALELARKFHPELIIADIVMPGMDGLVMSKEILSFNSISKIVLLTSFKEFDYAKEAVKLGVSNYWVKHEMDVETLTRELSSLSQEIERERKQREEDRRRLIGEWLAGSPLSDKQWQTAFLGRSTSFDRLHIIVLQADRPFPLLAGLGTEPSLSVPLLPTEWPEDDDSEGQLAAVRFREDVFVLLYVDNRVSGEGRMRDLLEGKAADARNAMERITEGTLSMSIVSGLRSFAEVPIKLAEALRVLAKSIFFGPSHTHRLNDLRPEDRLSKTLAWEEGVSRIKEMVAAHRFEEARLELSEQFNLAASSRDLAGFTDMCRQLISMVNRSRVSFHLPSLRELWEQQIISSTPWVSLEGIRTWFLSELEAISAAGRGQSALSRKMRLALDYMDMHFAEDDIGADTIARHLGISRDHFRHLFKEETGQTVLDRLTDIRMEHARKMLDEGLYKVYEIAERVGFRDSRYFSQVFRKTTGMNPLEYMERQR